MIQQHARDRALEKLMKKRGRPNQYGEQPIWMLVRVTLAIFGYDEARKAGAKHLAKRPSHSFEHSARRCQSPRQQ